MMSGEEGSPKADNHVVMEATSERIFNNATIFRYPFQSIDLGWLVEYIETCLSRSERWPASMRILEGFMAFAVMHEDPYMEDATFQFHKTVMDRCESKNWPNRVTKEMSIAFEVAHHVFETICVAAKYPSLEPSGKSGLLKMVEKLINDIDKAVKNPTICVGTKKTNEVLSVILPRMQVLRKSPDSPEAFDRLMGSLKALFFTISQCLCVSKLLPDVNILLERNNMNTHVCCEGCPCYTKLRTTYTLFMRDVEKMKVIDCLVIMAMKENYAENSIVSKLAEDLFARYDCRSPFVDRPIGRIQNGRLFLVRMALFDAFKHVRTLEDSATSETLAPLIDSVILSLYFVKKHLENTRGLNESVPLIDKAMATAEGIYERLGTKNCAQELATLRDHILGIFNYASAPEYHLAVHSKDPLVGKSVHLKCGNPKCPGKVKEMLKCSGCRMTYYCSVTCQREDWKTHRFLCREIGSRKISPTPIEATECPIRILKPVGLSK